jgi:hypothetical protein
MEPQSEREFGGRILANEGSVFAEKVELLKRLLSPLLQVMRVSAVASHSHSHSGYPSGS